MNNLLKFASRIIALQLAVCIAFSSIDMQAQGKRERLDVGIKEKKRQKSEKAKIGRDGKPRYNAAEIYAAEVEARLIKGINTTIKQMQRTASKFPKKSADRYELLKRLLHLYLENAAYTASAEHRQYDKAWNKWEAGGRKGPEPQLNNGRSNNMWRRLSSHASSIIGEYPRARDADEIMFNQALAQQFLRQEKQAARSFSNIIKKFPNSKYAGDSYFALGDYYFDRVDFRSAVNNYTNALKYKRAKRYGWALFKLGWSYYNLGNYKTSLKFWKQTVSYSQRAGKQGARLKEEALRDMVYAFAELRQVEPAIAYYKQQTNDKQYISNFLMLLGNTFADQGEFAKAIKVFKRFQAILPFDPLTPKTQLEICSLSYELGQFKMLWQELARLAKEYGPKSQWAARNNKNKKEFNETQVDIKDALLYYPKITHNKARNDAAFNQALIGYKLFLSTFPNQKEAAEIKFLMADILYFQKKYAAAGQLYFQIASLGRKGAVIYAGKKAENIHQKSSQYMLDSFLKDLRPELDKLEKRKVSPKSKTLPISSRSKNFIKGCTYYKKWYPKDRKSIKSCDIIVAVIYYRSNQKESKQFLMSIIQKYPKDGGETAVKQLIPLYVNDKRGLLAAVDKILAIPHYQKGKIGKELRDLKVSAENEAIKNEKDNLKRAKMYEAQAKKLPNSPEADKMWFNAAGDYLKAGEVVPAVAAYMNLVKRYPKSTLSQESLLQSAKLYDKLLEYKKAADTFMLYAIKFPKSKELAGAMSRSCDLKVAINASDAESTCMRFIQKFPDAGEPIIGQMIRIAELEGNYSKMAKLINGFYLPKLRLSPNQQIVALYKIYNSSGGRGSAAQKASSQILETFGRNKSKVSGEAIRYVGEIVFNRVKDAPRLFYSIPLKGGTVEMMSSSIEKKYSALTQTLTAFNPLFETQDPYWGSVGLYTLGKMHLAMAEALGNPPEIKGATIDDVKKELAPQVANQMKEANVYLGKALKTMKDFSIFNEYSIPIWNSMKELQNSPITFEEIFYTPDFIGTPVPGKIAEELR